MRIIRWTAALLALVIVVAFAVANRDPVVVRFDPLPFLLDVPLYALALGALGVGFFAGSMVQWLFAARMRRLARERKRRIGALETEAEGLRTEIARHQAAPEEVQIPLPPPTEGD
jgi:putative membrane protein